MSWLNRLPGFTQSAPGLEWAIWQRLPSVLFWGTAVPLGLAAALWFASSDIVSSAQQREQLMLVYQLLGLVSLHWTLVLAAAIGCAIVIVMKGPAFVADPYPPPGRDS